MLSRFETSFLATAGALYLAAMLLFWAQLFLWPKRDENASAKAPADFARLILGAGALFHLLSIAGQGPSLFTERAGTVGLFGWFLAVTFLVIGARLGTGSGSVVAPIALCAALFSLVASPLHTFTPTNQFESAWVGVHVFAFLLGYVALAFAFAASLLYLVQENLLKRRNLGGLWQKLPSLQVADEWIYRATAFGLALLTLGIFISVAFNAVSQPNYLAWRDPKVVFSALTWAVFALYIVARLKLGWYGRRSNMVVIYGFVLMAISFFSVPHLVTR